MGALGKAAGAALTAAMGAATAGLGVGLKVAAEMEQAKIGFTTMLGSAEKADSFLRDLQKFAATTPFELPGLQQSASRLIAVGTEADRVIPIMGVLGDATAAMGTGAEGIDRAVMALQQMQVKGKVTGEEMLQLAEAGVPAWEALASQLGVTTGEAQKMVTEGKVSVEDLFTAIESRQGESFARMNGMMAQQSQSLAGMWSTLKDTVQLQLAGMVEPLIPAIKASMEGALPIIDGVLASIKGKFEVLVTQVPNLLGALVDQDAQGVAEVLDNILGNTGAHINTIRTAAEQFFPVWNSVKETFQNVLEIARDLGPILGLVLAGGLRLAWEAVQLLAPALQAVTGWLADNEWAVMALVGAYGLLKGAMAAHAAFLSVQAAGGLLAYIKNMQVVQSLTKAWAAVQWVLNAALAANPIALVGIALAALVAGLVLAYQKSETFREIVQTAFRAVADAGKWMWENVLRPAWDAMKTAWQAVADGIAWAWNNLLKPAWDAVAAAGRWLWDNVLRPVFDAIGAAWSALITGIKWYWDNVLNPVWEVLKAAAQVLLAILVVAIFGPIALAWKGLVEGMKWAWENILKPAWEALQAGAQWMWNNVLRPIWDAVKTAWDALVTAMKWAWENILKPAWNALQAALEFLWNRVLSPIFSAIGSAWDGLVRGMKWVYDNVIAPVWRVFQDAIGAVRSAFDAAVGGIETAWNKIKEIAARPINFVIGTVLNDGLFKAFNWVIDTLGLPRDWRLNNLPLIRLASGGRVPGASPHDRADNIPAMLTAGEYVQPVSTVRYYGSDVMEAIRSRQIPREAFQHLASGGPVYQQLFNHIRGQFPRAKMNSGLRSGDPGHHGSGLAVDLGEQGFAGGNGRPYLAQMNQWLYDNYKSGLLELIYTGLGDNRPDVKNGQDHRYSASVNAGHKNHVHVAARSLAAMTNGKGGDGGGGGFFSAVTDVLGYIKDAVSKPLEGFFGQFGESTLTKTIKEVPGKMVSNVWEKAKNVVGDFLSNAWEGVVDFFTGGDEAPSGGVKGQVAQVANGYGWGSGSQWSALDWVVKKESGWNPKAKNPRSTASGLFQHINATWNASKRPGVTAGRMMDANVVEQAHAGMRYFRSRYGSPSAAKAYWERNGHYALGGLVNAMPGIFDTGGLLGHGDVGLNLSGKPERVLSPEQTESFDRWLNGGRTAEAAPVVGELHIHVGQNSDVRDGMEEAMFQLRRIKRGAGIGGSR